MPFNSEKRVRFIDECGPKNPKYTNIFKRVDTFEKRSWPPGIPQKPRELADAGFYYTGTFVIYLIGICFCIIVVIEI